MKLVELSAPRYNLELTLKDAEMLKTIMGRISGVGPARLFSNELHNILSSYREIETDDSICFSGTSSIV
jgi:hypothetical protein